MRHEAITPNDATPQLGNPAEDWWLREQCDWQHIEHLIHTGRILSLSYDFEATDLNPMFAAPTMFCGKIVTLDGRIIDSLDLKIQVPEDVVISPQAALVTESSPTDLHSPAGKDCPHIAAGKILLFFRNPYRKLWDALEDNALFITNPKGKQEEVRVYTIASRDGLHKAEFRIHKGGKFISFPYPDDARLPDGGLTYRDADGKRWKRIPAPAQTEGHNIGRYDDRLLWSFLHRNMSDEVFLTHTKKFQRFRTDTLNLAKLIAQLDTQGENGFKPGSKINAKTGTSYQAYTLSSLMEANTRDANPERGLDEGVRMPDGSKYDRRLAHKNPAYDVAACIALKSYLRTRAPEAVRTVELNADFDRIKPFLIGGEGFEMHPLRAFARNAFPHGAQLHLGVCVDINEEIEERRQAVMIRTDTDQKLEDYTFRGKKLLDMSVEELADMLKEQNRKPDALCEIIDLRKNPPVVPAAMAFHRGVGGDPERHEENRRFILSHAAFCKKLMEAHSKAMPPMPDWRSIRNPQPEEHLFTGLAAPKRYEFEMDGKKVLLSETVHAEWVKALRRNRTIDSVLRRAVKPQTIEFEVREDTLEAFIERMQAVDTHLQKYLGTTEGALPHYDAPALPDDDTTPTGTASVTSYAMLPPPDAAFIPPKWDTVPNPEKPGKTMRVPHVMGHEECERLTKNAREYLWKLRAELMYEFHDNSDRFTVQDRRGHIIPFPELNRMKQSDLADNLRTGAYSIHMEELNYSAHLLACMFRDAGRIAWVKAYMADHGRHEDLQAWETLEKNYFPALKALRIHGAPHRDVDDQHWMTATKGEKEVARLENNLRLGNDDLRPQGGQWGQQEIFMRNSDMAGPILSELKAHYRSHLEANPLSAAHLHTMGYDAASGLPIEHAPYTIPAGAQVITIDVPDRMLEKPLSHVQVAPMFVMLDPNNDQRKALENADPNTVLLLRGAQSGRTYLAAKHAPITGEAHMPNAITPNAYFAEIYRAAATRYADSGMKPPAPEHMLPVAVEALEPVPSSVVLEAQTIKIPRWEDFMATVSPVLGMRENPLTGLVIRDYGFTPTMGEARLQGMTQHDGKPGLGESGWELPATITGVRTLTLKEAREWIATGREQMNAAAALGKASVEDAREALLSDAISEAQAKSAGVSGLKALQTLLEKKSFTPVDARHYGYAGLSDMRAKLTGLFVDQELEAGRDDNRIHFVDIAPADKHHMHWHLPTRRPMVRLAGDAADAPFAHPSPAPGPDPTRLRGAPGIARARGTGQQKRA